MRCFCNNKKKKNNKNRMRYKKTVAVLGAGSWGTAVAIDLARAGNPTALWARSAAHVQDMLKEKRNTHYLPEILFPEQLTPTHNLDECVTNADHVIIAVPSNAFTSLLYNMSRPPQGLAWLTKGIDPNDNQLFSELVTQHWGISYPTAVISGPSFAKEVALGLPTALVVASRHRPFQQAICELVHTQSTRVYSSDDIEGVHLCGTVKNILAIACGVSDGIGYGANAKAALITRGLAEMQRLLTVYHAKPETCLGLAGVGDLVLTCTDNQSRNRRFGLLLGQGIASTTAEDSIGQIVEGKHNAAQICALSQKYQIDMPICQEVYEVLTGQHTPQEAVASLMSRPPREE
jgi:glycerol-3-phosphate dehydrogenase (NAD(P)+)